MKTRIEQIITVVVLLACVQPGGLWAQARGQRAAAKPPAPLTLKQVVESLSAKRFTTLESQVSKAGVDFQGTPEVLDILKQLGASAKLLGMIPAPPPPPAPPAPKVAGPLTVVCQPAECAVAVNDRYEGPTSQNRKVVAGLSPGEVTVDVFAEGYQHATRRVQLQQDKPAEEQFQLKRTAVAREQSGSASLLKAVAALGGIDAFAQLGSLEGAGTMQWMNNAGQTEQWTMTFSKGIGRDLTMTFKTKDGQCTSSVQAQGQKQDCKGGLKSGGEKIAEQGSTLFLSYQIQDVLQALMGRPLAASEQDDNRIESADAKDLYVLTLGKDSLPAGLVYRIGDQDAPIQIQYSNYFTINKAAYPGKIAVGRLNSAPVWIFTIENVKSRIVRGQ